MSKTALIAGATGLVGSHLLDQLLENESYSNVVVLTRRTLGFKHDKLQERIVYFDNIEDLDLSEKIDECYCALGTTTGKSGKDGLVKVDYTYVLNLANLCKKLGIPKLLIVSSQGADASSMFHYMRTKGQMEIAIEKVQFETTYIMRPSLILGDRNEYRFGEKAGEVLYKLASPFMQGRFAKHKPVEAGKIASCMIAKANTGSKGHFVIESDEIQKY